MFYSPSRVALAIFSLDEPWRTNFLEYIVSHLNGRWGAERLSTPEELQELLARDDRLCSLTVALYCRWTKTPPARLWREGWHRHWERDSRNERRSAW